MRFVINVEFEDFEFNYQKVEDIVPDSNVPESFGEWPRSRL